MAESVVSLVIDKLVVVVTQEVTLLKGVHEEVADIKDDLEAIQAFLKDADSKTEKESISEGVKLWVKQAREVAYQIEDVIDKYMLHTAQNHDLHGFSGFFKGISSSIVQLISYHEIASELRHLRKTLKEVKGRSERFQFIPSRRETSSDSSSNSISHDPRMSSLAIDEAELVGIESSRDELINLLLSRTSQRKVILVVGLGGVGKTTLARKVYENQKVRGHFDCHAWITVSQSYDKKQLLRSVLQEFCKGENEDFSRSIAMMDAPLLISELKEYLRAKPYLVVFDDVWDVGFWGHMEHALLDDDNGSRILFTTRNEDVADFCRSSCLVGVYRMKLLTQQEAWELFCKRAFKFEFERQCPEDLEELSYNIVKRCGGLSLAIVAIGGLLAKKKKMVTEWKKLFDSFGSTILADDPHLQNVPKILSLSYGDLFYRLKSCFLFFGMFPEDFSINRRRLIQLWVAMGFVQEKRNTALEEVAEEYLTELVHRSLVQVDAVNVKGIPNTVHIHDMLREVILSKSEELSFCHVSSNCSIFEGIARHLSIMEKGNDNPKSSTKSQTRSIMVFDNMELRKPMIHAIFSRCKLLTALDFEGCSIDRIPKEIGEMLHLRYVNLRNTLVSQLPKSIGKLRNLEFIDLRGSQVYELSVEISWFPKLRHLLGDDLKICGSIGHLEFLQTLFRIRVDNVDVRLIYELEMLKQLRKLGIYGLRREDGRGVCISLKEMTNLRSLYISTDGGGILEVQSMSSPPLELQTLKLEGQLERLPDWISKLHNLSKLRLSKSRLMDDPMEVLKALPNLKVLFLMDGYDGKKLHLERGGCLKLKRLYLEEMNDLDTIIIDKGALPLLEELYIERCPLLKKVPAGIRYLKGLQLLWFVLMSNEFKQRWSSEEGRDYLIVKHVPRVMLL